MPSVAYVLFLEAMRKRRQIVCTYRGHRRELCPILLGHRGGEEVSLTFQFGGESNSALPPGGQWRCLSLADVENIVLREGEWHEGTTQLGNRQSCMTEVDYDVHPWSPYRPRKRL